MPFFKVHLGDANKPLTAAEHTVVTGPYTKDEAETLSGETIVAKNEGAASTIVICKSCQKAVENYRKAKEF